MLGSGHAFETLQWSNAPTTMGTTTWISDTFFELATQNAPTFLGEASEGEAVMPAQGGHRRQCVDGVREALQLKNRMLA